MTAAKYEQYNWQAPGAAGRLPEAGQLDVWGFLKEGPLKETNANTEHIYTQFQLF